MLKKQAEKPSCTQVARRLCDTPMRTEQQRSVGAMFPTVWHGNLIAPDSLTHAILSSSSLPVWLSARGALPACAAGAPLPRRFCASSWHSPGAPGQRQQSCMPLWVACSCRRVISSWDGSAIPQYEECPAGAPAGTPPLHFVAPQRGCPLTGWLCMCSWVASLAAGSGGARAAPAARCCCETSF